MFRKTMMVFATILALIGCDNGNERGGDTEASRADSLSLRVAVMPTLDCLPVYVASHSGIFERESLNVMLVPFTAHMDCDTAIVGGSVHAIPTDLVRAERLIKQGTPLHYATTTALSWQLLTAKTARIRKLPQLDDRMIAMTRFSATAMLTDQLVDSAKLQPERVFPIQVNDVLVRLNMMETGIMDAMLLPEPQATVARCLGSNILYDNAADSMALGAFAFSEKALKDTLRRQQMEVFMKAWDEACDSINTLGLEHYRGLIADRCHVKEQVVDSLVLQHPMHFRHATPPRQKDIDHTKIWLGYMSAPKTENKTGNKPRNKKGRKNK